MPYSMKPLACDPVRIKGMSERLIISHYGNNYGEAVKWFNSIADHLASLDFKTAPNFLVNGLKCEQLIVTFQGIIRLARRPYRTRGPTGVSGVTWPMDQISFALARCVGAEAGKLVRALRGCRAERIGLSV